jgi:hypothetical protein
LSASIVRGAIDIVRQEEGGEEKEVGLPGKELVAALVSVPANAGTNTREMLNRDRIERMRSRRWQHKARHREKRN